jgi:hypothetical protein
MLARPLQSTAVHVVDWDADGDWDLLIGTIDGNVTLIRNDSQSDQLAFGEPETLQFNGRPWNSDAAPVVADWDGDGRQDLIVGTGEGSVFWVRNIGSPQHPKLDAARWLVPESPAAKRRGAAGNTIELGIRVKPWVVDFNGDGQLDLLLGDYGGSFQGRPMQTADEIAEELRSLRELPVLRRNWAEAFSRYRTLLAQAEVAPSSHGAKVREKALDEVKGFSKQIAETQKLVMRFEPQYQSHGYVWLFLRKTANSQEHTH